MASDNTLTDLQRRALRHGWRLTEEAGELVLLGNGAPAAWRSVASAAVWFDAQDRAKVGKVEAQMELWEVAA